LDALMMPCALETTAVDATDTTSTDQVETRSAEIARTATAVLLQEVHLSSAGMEASEDILDDASRVQVECVLGKEESALPDALELSAIFTAHTVTPMTPTAAQPADAILLPFAPLQLLLPALDWFAQTTLAQSLEREDVAQSAHNPAKELHALQSSATTTTYCLPLWENAAHNATQDQTAATSPAIPSPALLAPSELEETAASHA